MTNRLYYHIYYGNSVPFNCRVFTTWAEATKFMLKCLNEGTEIHSVHKSREE